MIFNPMDIDTSAELRKRYEEQASHHRLVETAKMARGRKPATSFLYLLLIALLICSLIVAGWMTAI